MSPISEASTKVLIEYLDIALDTARKSKLRLDALEAVLEEEQPSLHKSFMRKVKELQNHDDNMQTVLALEKLKTALQK